MTNRKQLMTIAIITISIASAGLFLSPINSENGVSLFSKNLSDEKTLVDFIEMPNGNFAIPSFIKSVEASEIVDTMFLADDPANWFQSGTGGQLAPVAAGTPLTRVDVGDAVTFDLDERTDTKHTVTLLLPLGKILTTDQEKADDNEITVSFDEAGVYLFSCKVHPYMQGVVVVNEANGDLPVVTGDDLPALKNVSDDLTLTTLQAGTVLTNIAPLDEAIDNPVSGLLLDKESKWDILKNDDTFHGYTVGDKSNFEGGVGQIWVNTQFERVSGQESGGEDKPGSITVLDATDLTVIDEMNGMRTFDNSPQDESGKWNNPHNMWTNSKHDVIYNGNWFGNWLNLIERDSGKIIDSITVGKAPTHIVTFPAGPEEGILTLPLSAEDEILMIEDKDGELLKKIDHFETGSNNNHPHGQWITSDGEKILIPNVFQGSGLEGSVAIMKSDGKILKEFTTVDDPNLVLPVAASIGKVNGVNTGYVANIGSGMVTVIDIDNEEIINDILVACFAGPCEDKTVNGGVLDTLKLPIQTPISPDGKYVVTAVFSLTSHLLKDSGLDPDADSIDTIAVIDAEADDGRGALVAELPCPAGCHGVNWGAKLGGGYYAYVTSQHANVLTVVDPNPGFDANGVDGIQTDGSDAAIVAIVPLTNGGPDLTDGTGGQGILPLPLVSSGWIKQTVNECEPDEDGNSVCSSEVNGWLADLTPEQRFE